MRTCILILTLALAAASSVSGQTIPSDEVRAQAQEFTIYFEGIAETAVTRVAAAPVRFDEGGGDEERIRGFYWFSEAPGVLVLGVPGAALAGMEQISFSLRGDCGSHFLYNVTGNWDALIAVAVEVGECKTKNIPPHTLPTPPPDTLYSSSWLPGDPGYNAQRDAAVQSLLAQLGIAEDVILALCTGPCPSPKECLASNITSSTSDDVDKSEENDPAEPGEKRWKVKILQGGSQNGWDGQVYCACLTNA